jgi:hypothetical protein
MSNKEEIKQLEEKINQISSQLITLSNAVKELKHAYVKDSKIGRKNDWSLFWRGAVVGIVGGLFSGLLVSYQMKIYEYFNMSLIVWIFSTIVTIIFLALMLLVMWKISEKPPKNPNQLP